MAALASGSRGAFRIVGEVVRVVLLPAADLLLGHTLLALRLLLGSGGMFTFTRHWLLLNLGSRAVIERSASDPVAPSGRNDVRLYSSVRTTACALASIRS